MDTNNNIDLSTYIYEQFEKNPIGWGRIYLPHHFRINSPKFHLKIVKEALNNTYLAIAAPRESSKSTLLAFLYPLHSICFKKRRFILIVSNTYSKAARTLENVKKEFKDNNALKEDYPITIVKDSEGDSIIRHPDGFETRILCKGAEQIGSIRGEKFGAYRPDLILNDDIEDDEMVRNPERRAELKDLFDEVLGRAGETGLTQIIVIGTILHDDSLLAKLVSLKYYPEYRKLLFKARKILPDGTKVSIWKEKWSLEELDRLEKEKPDVFAKEMQNDPASGTAQVFNKDDFRYWRVDNLNYVLYDKESNVTGRGSLSDCKAAIACDLAWSEKRTADDSVIMCLYLTPYSDLLIDNYIAEKGMREDTLNEYIFSAYNRLSSITGKFVPLGIEKAMRESVAKWSLEREMRRRNIFIPIKEIKWETDKIQRIQSALYPRYKQHSLFHKQGMGDLEYQLVRFPSGVHDDVIDCLQIGSKILEFPKHIRKEETTDSHFEWLRNKALERKYGKSNKFSFGNKMKSKQYGLPAQESWR